MIYRYIDIFTTVGPSCLALTPKVQHTKFPNFVVSITLSLPVMTCPLVCLSSLVHVAYIANNIDPNQTAPKKGSSLIRIYIVCFNEFFCLKWA